jgi:hypothetical protein
MKRLLSFLLMIVFMHVQVPTAFAKRGGPDIGGAQNVDTIGTFAGVLVPVSQTNPSSSRAGTTANSIGLFSLGVPDIGVAQGAVVVFVEGTAFNGAITGIADPESGLLRGIIDAVSTYTIFNPLDPTGPGFAVFAQGNIEANIRETASFTFGSVSQAAFFATTRLEGEAKIDIFGLLEIDGTPRVSNTATFAVDGFKQSSTVNITTDLSITPGGNNP